MKKIFASLMIILVLIGTVFLSGCKAQQNKIVNILLEPNDFSFLHLDEFKSREFTGIVPEYSSEVSVCFEDKNQEKNLMIFSVPIQYINQYDVLTPIDTRISNVTNFKFKQNGYVYQTASSDISAYYPEYLSSEKGVIVNNKDYQYEFGIHSNEGMFSSYSEIKTFIEEPKYGIVYKDAFGKNTTMQSYPTSLGTRNEIIINKRGTDQEFTFWLDADGIKPRAESGGYILLISNEKGEDGKDNRRSYSAAATKR